MQYRERKSAASANTIAERREGTLTGILSCDYSQLEFFVVTF